jgi:hypothetical protein
MRLVGEEARNGGRSAQLSVEAIESSAQQRGDCRTHLAQRSPGSIIELDEIEALLERGVGLLAAHDVSALQLKRNGNLAAAFDEYSLAKVKYRLD